ncbi:MAG: ice-binding family protein [Candidatus Dormibacteria bacterium]
MPLLAATLATAAVALPGYALAAAQPRMGTTLDFAVLAGSTITNTGSTVLDSELGLDPGTSVTGFPPGTSGTQHIHDAVALQAQNDLTTAYTDAANSPSTQNLSGQDLGGMTLVPGVYTFSSSAQLTGPLTLSGDGVFIFQIGSTLTSATGSTVITSAGAQACAVFWQVGSSATLGSSTQFQGNLMALTSITMVTGSRIVSGRALARNGALTMDTNRITPPAGSCSVAAGPTPTPTVAVTPSPSPTPVSSPGPTPAVTPTAGPAPPGPSPGTTPVVTPAASPTPSASPSPASVSSPTSTPSPVSSPGLSVVVAATPTPGPVAAGAAQPTASTPVPGTTAILLPNTGVPPQPWSPWPLAVLLGPAAALALRLTLRIQRQSL